MTEVEQLVSMDARFGHMEMTPNKGDQVRVEHVIEQFRQDVLAGGKVGSAHAGVFSCTMRLEPVDLLDTNPLYDIVQTERLIAAQANKCVDSAHDEREAITSTATGTKSIRWENVSYDSSTKSGNTGEYCSMVECVCLLRVVEQRTRTVMV